MKLFSRRGAILALAMTAGLATGTAVAAADYPSKPITMVIPYRAGGSTETMGRIFADALGAELGTKVVVKTRPGAGGAVGATEVAASDPDGYTIMFAASSSLLWPPLTQDVEFDLDSFQYVAKVTEYQQAIVTRADAPYETLDELITEASDQKLNFADQSPMSRAYINYIAKERGVEFTGIPTKGGGEMVPFLLGGKVDFAWSGGVHNRYGDKIKVLLSMNAQRLLASPDIPSIGETFGVSMPSQAVIVAPTGIPADVIATLETAIEAATTNDELVDMVTNKLMFPVAYLGAEAITAEIDETAAGLQAVVAATQ
ncbi:MULTISPECIES: Bug family tripartite tricarboxylate transporter substrate binding protein [Roseovarius]|jgi:tripartite-type tricarboxylate transporter receptor subunit TctC|uniref:Bug family tripartite tricarboxylate transporter substrate binding protein n=1 Tax=Roseovarius TaxID=74030 RepID=UPI00273E27D0|nr:MULTISPECIES: tripartite tricarboxylate transporter substrate binding protein [unclassified Roseovarius]